MNTLTINVQPYNLNTNLEQGLMRGSAWNNLYKPYKFETTKISTNSPTEQIMLLIQIYSFVAVELNLFIATHQNCNEAKEILKQVLTEKKKMIDYFESNNHALSSCSINNYNYFDGDKNVVL